MTKSDLIERLSAKYLHLSSKDVEVAIREILEQMAITLQSGDRIEIRGFGSFSLHYRAPRVGRNPKTGEALEIAASKNPTFKAGKALKDAVN